MGKKISLNETRRTIVFDNGWRLDLHNVTSFDPSGTHLRIRAEEGFVIVNPARVLCHIVKNESRQDEALPEVEAEDDVEEHS